MNGYRFYADLSGTLVQPEQRDNRFADDVPVFPKRTTRAQLRTAAGAGKQCNVIALFTGPHGMQMNDFEGFVSVYGHADSAVQVSGIARDYLRQCRRIDEALARNLHPRLFARLDAN